MFVLNFVPHIVPL